MVELLASVEKVKNNVTVLYLGDTFITIYLFLL